MSKDSSRGGRDLSNTEHASCSQKIIQVMGSSCDEADEGEEHIEEEEEEQEQEEWTYIPQIQEEVQEFEEELEDLARAYVEKLMQKLLN